MLNMLGQIPKYVRFSAHKKKEEVGNWCHQRTYYVTAETVGMFLANVNGLTL